ncbi:MAG: hypothetical protein U9N50_07330 [Pseudomonadota bacterium]|nr:hypothetical protein [Pseudomonadota bacterium]
MRLSNINEPRDGADKFFSFQVLLTHLPEVVIEDTETDLYAALDRAADRSGRTAGRRLARQCIRGRSSGLHDGRTKTCCSSEYHVDTDRQK